MVSRAPKGHTKRCGLAGADTSSLSLGWGWPLSRRSGVLQRQPGRHKGS